MHSGHIEQHSSHFVHHMRYDHSIGYGPAIAVEGKLANAAAIKQATLACEGMPQDLFTSDYEAVMQTSPTIWHWQEDPSDGPTLYGVRPHWWDSIDYSSVEHDPRFARAINKLGNQPNTWFPLSKVFKGVNDAKRWCDEWNIQRVERWFSSSNAAIYAFCEVHREYVNHGQEVLKKGQQPETAHPYIMINRLSPHWRQAPDGTVQRIRINSIYPFVIHRITSFVFCTDAPLLDMLHSDFHEQLLSFGRR